MSACPSLLLCLTEGQRTAQCGWLVLQTDFLSFALTGLDKASIRSRSHGEEVSKLVDQSSDADMSEERRKSETDLGAPHGPPAVKSAVDTNDLRFIEREVRTSSPAGDGGAAVYSAEGTRSNTAWLFIVCKLLCNHLSLIGCHILENLM